MAWRLRVPIFLFFNLKRLRTFLMVPKTLSQEQVNFWSLILSNPNSGMSSHGWRQTSSLLNPFYNAASSVACKQDVYHAWCGTN